MWRISSGTPKIILKLCFMNVNTLQKLTTSNGTTFLAQEGRLSSTARLTNSKTAFFHKHTTSIQLVMWINKHPVAQDIQNYLRITGRKRVDCKKLLEALSGEEMLVNASLLQRYEHQGAVGLPNNRLPTEEELTLVRGTGDIGPPGGGHGRKNKTLLAEVFKLPRKSGYGKLIEVIERQTNIIYTNDK